MRSRPGGRSYRGNLMGREVVHAMRYHDLAGDSETLAFVVMPRKRRKRGRYPFPNIFSRASSVAVPAADIANNGRQHPLVAEQIPRHHKANHNPHSGAIASIARYHRLPPAMPTNRQLHQVPRPIPAWRTKLHRPSTHIARPRSTIYSLRRSIPCQPVPGYARRTVLQQKDTLHPGSN